MLNLFQLQVNISGGDNQVNMTQINFNASYTSVATPSRAMFEDCMEPPEPQNLSMYNNNGECNINDTICESETQTASNFLVNFNSMNTSDLIETLLNNTNEYQKSVNDAYKSCEKRFGQAPSPTPSSSSLLSEYDEQLHQQQQQQQQQQTGGTKRKLDEFLKIDNVVGQFTKTKIRPKYKNSTIQSSATVEQSINSNTNICTVASSQEITHYFNNDFAPYLMRFDDNNYNSNRFSDHMSETGYYMFVVKKSDVKAFEIVFAKYVNYVVYEYTSNYYQIDNRVFVVSFNKVRFMISYKLVKDCNIEIPPSQDVCSDEVAAQNPKKCHFMDVHHTFKAALTSYFNLDMYYAQTNFVTLLQSLGERKCGFLLNKLYEMYQDKSLFTLPIMLSRKESTEVEATSSNNFIVSPYVSQILRFSEGISFPDNEISKYVVDNLDKIVNKKTTLTFKYSSVAKLLFNNYKYNDNVISSDNCESLKKIKKEDGNMHIVEQYLTLNMDNQKGHNFIVLSFKNDERLTIAKKKESFFWLCGEIKQDEVNQAIQKYNKFKHNMFVIGKANRRESVSLHNNLLKLLALILQGLVSLNQAIVYADQKLNCKYKKFDFN
ncbi:ie-1 [Palpita vitrealis nucleopolyhedrovirus]|uniref:Ie-1 n=1 Tax=Palpita vitrealis nucleopolyhedrovirus TaxID=2951960 RepID=A0AAE9RYZ0_9ABAC|nr:ie-1 [Palpita vitrealis nucleopolyhedrovirus]